ncbi:MAG: glycosyltransferase [Acidobacteriaceae bacterium]|nr:glycosyltransferase [Acidobacteriaceae bacterium]
MPAVLLLNRYDRLGASSRLRFLDYIPHLEAVGFEVTPAPFFDDGYLEALYQGRLPNVARIAWFYARRLAQLLRLRRYDLIWLEKEALPWLPFWIERGILSRIPYVVDFDDAWFLRYSNHSQPLIRRLLGDKLDAIVRGAALVVVGNDYLATWAERAGARAILQLPTVVDLARYQAVPPQASDRFTIGWIGSPNSTGYLGQISEALRAVCSEHQVRLRLVGAGSFALPGVEIEHLAWHEETEVEAIAGFDVGIMPLEDTPWARGKCGYKLVQYMGVGRPVVASPVGINQLLVEHAVNGFLSADPAGWVTALGCLRDNPDLRQRMGAAGRQRVESRYSLQVNAPRLARALNHATLAA